MNKRGFAHVRVGHAGAAHALSKRDCEFSAASLNLCNYVLNSSPASNCASGGFYTSPTTGTTISTSDSFNISWDTSCLQNTQAVDIYLIAPSLANSRIHEWQNVNYGLGSYQTTLEPRWWNDSSSMALQLSIITSGSQPFLSPFPAGPVFTATYTAPTSGSTPASADLNSADTVTYVNNFPTNSSLSKGKIAAGVLIPLLFIGLGIAAYLKISRARGQDKRKRFSEAVDKRMSTISTEWKSMSAAGASAAIRNSIAVSGAGNRNSAFSFGAIRPISTAAVEGDHSSVEKTSMDAPQMSQLRPGLRASGFGDRVSRVSFAADVRPSMESRRTVASRAFHTGFVPPVPTRNDSGELSPTQAQGPFSLSAEDIQSRMSGDGSGEPRPSMDEVWPSLSMMRTGNTDQGSGDDYLLPSKESVELPLPPVPAHPGPASPPGMMPMPASVMSPDEMLRAYAERKMTSPPPTSPIAFPTPSVNYNGNGMRTLYSPSTPDSATATHVKQQSSGDKRYTTYEDMDPYGGTVN
ncbi:hypothetical protein HYDPIDRAFT_94457 [Hydnomerulius pinastri MD-312]|uniref:Uncharacterized protein n=1 Tax=Hydnomerulius pinastri MD-312 TaxID=994086 RepID=A0A0C9VWB0_9AGAM|nr:hypothetical protein HYDPIDRAFT_94457 [Hydnomerulius pinastri MD-312]